MTAVYYFSGTGHSRAIAEYIAGQLGCPPVSIERTEELCVTTAVVVFPVYSDNLPAPVRDFLHRLNCEHAALIAAYGRISRGNVITQAARLCRGEIICGAYVPTGHTYLEQPAEFDREALAPVIERIRNPHPAVIPKEHASFLGNLLPEARARMAVKLRRSDSCSGCGICAEVCPAGTMTMGVPGGGCLRCLRCVKACPVQALSAEYMPILKAYLSRERTCDTVIYL